MIKVVIAGGSGELAREVIDSLLARKEHEIMVISRAQFSCEPKDGLRCRIVDYQNRDSLVDVLRGYHTVLSFINQSIDHGNASQKALIDACIAAGVKRFAPSEYG
ncbi:hypothetical protein ONS95_012750 [Cadophora gregata]|uniref:uncharacterized protein n=1 Tax=Cadophora gregata TaxID=51156 RepID=UPI0026DA90A0|nr:uncharacterized protein ONS95_012750 [Cadophora gregata]KAK0118465.1 hypothetical protein ONS95_012750 [Cadophora gregata]KAK0123534.1 hypothetical protein ONS96_010516 [Cadophora gregata f. sp. sojae]